VGELRHDFTRPARHRRNDHQSILDAEAFDMDGVRVVRVIGDFRSGFRRRSHLWARFYPRAVS
jgi:hypothetical protein